MSKKEPSETQIAVLSIQVSQLTSSIEKLEKQLEPLNKLSVYLEILKNESPEIHNRLNAIERYIATLKTRFVIVVTMAAFVLNKGIDLLVKFWSSQ